MIALKPFFIDFWKFLRSKFGDIWMDHSRSSLMRFAQLLLNFAGFFTNFRFSEKSYGFLRISWGVSSVKSYVNPMWILCESSVNPMWNETSWNHKDLKTEHYDFLASLDHYGCKFRSFWDDLDSVAFLCESSVNPMWILCESYVKFLVTLRVVPA